MILPFSEPVIHSENNVTKISGDWLASTVQSAGATADGRLLASDGQIDWSQLGRVDSAGAFALIQALGASDLGNDVPDRLRRVLDIVAPAIQEHATKKPKKSYGFFTRLGRKVVAGLSELYGNILFLGRSEVGVGRAVINPRRLRVRALVSVMQQGSLEALPIIMTMTFFIGAVVALVGTNLLQNLGASVFTVQLVGVSVLREFGVLIPAILLAGRSTSTFAAQIGAMRMNQETDAMVVMGVDLTEALVTPRVLAMIITLPLLSVAAMIAGILGGLLVSWASLDISPVFFVERLRQTVDLQHFWLGLIKTPVMAIIIALTGCRQGMAVRGDVEVLGRNVTTAVVQALFAIILLDAAFALVFMKLDL